MVGGLALHRRHLEVGVPIDHVDGGRGGVAVVADVDRINPDQVVHIDLLAGWCSSSRWVRQFVGLAHGAPHFLGDLDNFLGGPAVM